MKSAQPLSWLLLALIIAIFCFFANQFFSERIASLVRSIPEPEQYHSDEFVFLRTFFLIDHGENYYQAFNESVTKKAGATHLTKDSFQWRLPTIFYLWSLVANNGIEIGMLFIVLSALSLVSVFLIARLSLPPFLSLLSPLFLVPYFLDALYYRPSFLFVEWWGFFFFLFGLHTLLYKRNIFALLCFSLSMLTRELFVIPIISMLIVSLTMKTQRNIFAGALLIFLLFYSTHVLAVQQQNVPSSAQTLFSRIHLFNIAQFQTETAFSMRLYPLLRLKVQQFFLAIAATTLLIKSVQKQANALLLLCSFLPFALISPFLGNPFNDYWGVVFMPLAISLTPLVLSLKK